MFSKLTLHGRYYIFVSICLIWMVGYQAYNIYQADALIYEALEEGNERVNRYTLINDELRAENVGLKHNLTREQALLHASMNHVKMLEKQMNVIGDFYLKEMKKVNDELFDLRHKKK